MAAAYPKNRTSHKGLKMETSFKMLHSEGADLLHLRGIGARTFVHIKTPRPGKGMCVAIARRANLIEFGTQRLAAF